MILYNHLCFSADSYLGPEQLCKKKCHQEIILISQALIRFVTSLAISQVVWILGGLNLPDADQQYTNTLWMKSLSFYTLKNHHNF